MIRIGLSDFHRLKLSVLIHKFIKHPSQNVYIQDFRNFNSATFMSPLLSILSKKDIKFLEETQNIIFDLFVQL